MHAIQYVRRENELVLIVITNPVLLINYDAYTVNIIS